MGSSIHGGDVSHARVRPPRRTLVPPFVTPPERALTGLRFAFRFLRNPLEVIPNAVYEQDVVSFMGGSTPFEWITGPALIKAILLDDHEAFEKAVQIRVLSPLLGRGILTSEAAEWQWQRRTAAPMFRRHELMTFVPAFVRATQRLLETWRQAPSGSRRDVERDMTRVTFDVVCATLLPSGDGRAGRIVETSTDRFQKSGNWHRLYIIANAPQWLPQPGRRVMHRAVQTLRSLVAGMVEERSKARDAPDDLMHRLMNACDPETGAPMNDDRLIDNLLTFYLAGHETTAMALTWTLYLLACAPEWTGTLKAEIARVTGGASVTAEHIDKLVLTQQFLKESMRVYPPVPLLTRRALADITVGAHTIKAGTSIVMPIYAMHRHRKRWHDPNHFDPTRFAPENEAVVSRYQYMPFGAGPRVCIGMAFAMIEATTMLATMLQAARFENVYEHHPTPIARVTLHPKGGMPLRVYV